MAGGVTVQWLGDISLNGPFCDPHQATAVRQNLEAVVAGLSPCDLRIANWESPLWGDGRVNERKVPRLATLPHAARAMEALRLDVALLANNHAYDCLEEGFANTVAFLREIGVATLGAGWSETEAARPLVLDRRGLRIGLLNYVGRDTHPNVPPASKVFLNWFDERRALEETAALAAETDAVFVHLHWGPDAFIRIPTIDQRRTARRLVEAGARVVVGGHAHVLQGHERWGRGYILYGMGNFLFWPAQAAPIVPVPWPRYVREVGVASCRLVRAEVGEVALRHLVQEGLALRWDETPRRERIDRMMCRVLGLSDAWFSRVRWLESLHRQFRFRLRGMAQAGGFWPWLASRGRRRMAAGGVVGVAVSGSDMSR